jgi:hypothetical protein
VGVVDVRAVICRGHARTVEEAVAVVKAAHEQAVFTEAAWAASVEALVAATVPLYELVRGWQRDAWQKLFSGKLAGVQATGEALRDAYARTFPPFSNAAAALAEVEAAGYAIEGADELRRAQEDLRRLQADFERRWPFFDAAELAEARGRAQRGEALSAEEFSRALLGDD